MRRQPSPEIELLRPLVGRRAAALALGRFPLPRLLTAEREAILAIPGLARSRAEALLALPRLLEAATRGPSPASPFASSRDVYLRYRFRLGLAEQERFLVLALNSRNAVVAEETVALGTVNSVHVRPADILRPAIRTGAAGIICLHNHPSGDPSPSPEDGALTQRILQASALVGIRLLDHLVVCLSGYHSFADSGTL